MKTAIFSGLVWAGSSASTKLCTSALAGSAQMLSTLRGWAIAALIISVLMHIFGREEFQVRQIPESLEAFGLFSAFAGALVLFFRGGPAPGTATVATFAGGVVAPVMAMMALEFPDLRSPALKLGALPGTGLVSCAFTGFLLTNPAPRPQPIRTNQRPSPAEIVRHSNGPARA